jgi:hypothetical protein
MYNALDSSSITVVQHLPHHPKVSDSTLAVLLSLVQQINRAASGYL